MRMTDTEFDDPVWEYLLVSKIQPYLPAIRKWWDNYDNMHVISTGIFPIDYEDVETPPGLFFRFTHTAARSPIKNVQAFPFIIVAYLQITGVPGGVMKMVERVCKNLTVEEFTVIEKHNLPSTYQRGQLLCIVPTRLLNGARELGKFVYLTLPEMCAVVNDNVPNSVKAKCSRFLNLN